VIMAAGSLEVVGPLIANRAPHQPTTHHRALLAIDHAAHKLHIARQAAEHGWSAEDLEAHIRAEQPQTGKPRGRPAQPAEVKWLNAVRRQATTQSDAAAFATRVGQLPAEAQATLRADLAALRQHLDALAQALG